MRSFDLSAIDAELEDKIRNLIALTIVYTISYGYIAYPPMLRAS